MCHVTDALLPVVGLLWDPVLVGLTKEAIGKKNVSFKATGIIRVSDRLRNSTTRRPK